MLKRRITNFLDWGGGGGERVERKTDNRELNIG